jgi:hypothetical protein
MRYCGGVGLYKLNNRIKYNRLQEASAASQADCAASIIDKEARLGKILNYIDFIDV